MSWNTEPFVDIEDYSRCADCGESEFDCKYIDEDTYCEGCYDNSPCCEACGEHTFLIVHVEYQTIQYSETKEYDHDETLCDDCFKTIEQDINSINIIIKKDERNK
jgi:hypothetical protein